MTNPNRKGQAGTPVSSSMQSSNVTPYANTSFIVPYGLNLRQTINAGRTSVVIPNGITWVYAICVGGGAAGSNSGITGTGGGGAGAIAWGWTLASTACYVAVGDDSLPTRYGNVIAASGGRYNVGARLGAGGMGGGVGQFGTITGPTGGTILATNYWGISSGVIGAGSAGGSATAGGGTVGNGGDGISGGGGAASLLAGSQINTGGNGGSGIVGGGGGAAGYSTTSNVGGKGGDGFNFITNTVTTGGAGAFGNGGGGAGVAGNGLAPIGANNGGAGGLGGGAGGSVFGSTNGTGGAGILYLYY